MIGEALDVERRGVVAIPARDTEAAHAVRTHVAQVHRRAGEGVAAALRCVGVHGTIIIESVGIGNPFRVPRRAHGRPRPSWMDRRASVWGDRPLVFNLTLRRLRAKVVIAAAAFGFRCRYLNMGRRIKFARVVRAIPTAHLAAIGRTVTNFSGLDVAVDRAISRLLNVHSGAHSAITVGFGTESKLDLMESLAETTLAHGPARKEILSIASDIRAALSDRNFIAHAHWMGGGVSASTIFGYLGKRNKAGVRQASWKAEEIEAIAQHFNDLEGRLIHWSYRKVLRKKPVAWHERHLPQRSIPRRRKSG